VGRGHRGDEELAAVGAGASVGHGQQAGRHMLQLKVLILKLGTVYGLTACTGMRSGGVSEGRQEGAARYNGVIARSGTMVA
jgi:hypothetical protein